MILSGDGSPVIKAGDNYIDKDGITVSNNGVITPPGKGMAADFGNVMYGTSGQIIIRGNTIIAPDGTYVLNGHLLTGPGGRSWTGVMSIQDAKAIVVKEQKR